MPPKDARKLPTHNNNIRLLRTTTGLTHRIPLQTCLNLSVTLMEDEINA